MASTDIHVTGFPLADRVAAASDDRRSGREEDDADAFAALLLRDAPETAEPNEDPAAGSAAAMAQPAAEATLELSVERKTLGERTAQRMARLVWQAGVREGGRLGVALEPRALGRLGLRVTLSGNQVDVWTEVDDADVARLLLRSRDELGDALVRWGLTLGRFEVHTRALQPLGSAKQIARFEQEALVERLLNESYMEVIA